MNVPLHISALSYAMLSSHLICADLVSGCYGCVCDELIKFLFVFYKKEAKHNGQVSMSAYLCGKRCTGIIAHCITTTSYYCGYDASYQH